MENVISILSRFVADAVWCCAAAALLSLGCAVVWKWQDLAQGLKDTPKFFRVVFVAMMVVAASLFSKVDTNSVPPNLSAPRVTPAPMLQIGSPDEPVADVARFAAIDVTATGVDLVLHRPEADAAEAVEVTLVGSTNLVTATWEPFMDVTFPAGETDVSVTVGRAMLDAHAVSNACFFAFINSGDRDGDGLADWDERFNFKTDPDNAYSVLEGTQACSGFPWMAHAFKDSLAVKFGGRSPFEILDDFRTVYEHAIHTGAWNGPLTDGAVIGSGDVVVTLGIDKRPNQDASTLHVGDLAIPLCPGCATRLRITIPAYARMPVWHERDSPDGYDYYRFLDGIVTVEGSTALLMKGSDSSAFSGETSDLLKAVKFPSGPVCVHGVGTRSLHVEFADGPVNNEREELFGYTCAWSARHADGTPCTDLTVVDRTDHGRSGERLNVDLALDFPPDQTRRLRLEYVPGYEAMASYEYYAGPRSVDIEVHYCPRPEWRCDCAGHGADWPPPWMSPLYPCTCSGEIDPDDWDGDGVWNGYDPFPRDYTWTATYDQDSGIRHWTVWDRSARFANPAPGSSSGAVVFERTFLLDRVSRWEQFFLSTDLGGSGGLDLAGATLEWEDDGGARGGTSTFPAGDSLRLQLSPSARTLTVRLRATADRAFTRPFTPLHLLSYTPEVQVAGNWIADDETTYNRYLALTNGAESAVSISIDRSARPCRAALASEESDVGALLQEFYELAFIDFEIYNQQFYGQRLYNPFAGGAEVVYRSLDVDGTTRIEDGEFWLPPGGVYPVPPYGTLPSPVGGSDLILVLDPFMMCDDGTCAEEVRLVRDPDGGTYSVDDGYPFDTACLRRGYASGEDGSSPFAEPAIDPGVGGIPFDVVSWWTDTVQGCHTGAVSVCGHEVWWAGHEAHHASCRDFAPADPLSDRCGCCEEGCADGNCDALESPGGGRRLRLRIPFGQPRKGQVSGFFFMDADGPLSIVPGVFQTVMRGGGSLEGAQGVDAENRPETVYACGEERGRDIHVRQDGNAVLLTVRDHATGRLEHMWRVWNDGGSASRVVFLQTSRLGNPMQRATFDWDASKGSWSKSDGISGLREEVEVFDRLSDDESPSLVETRTRSDAEGTLLGRTVREWARLGAGNRAVLREVRRREQRFDPDDGE